MRRIKVTHENVSRGRTVTPWQTLRPAWLLQQCVLCLYGQKCREGNKEKSEHSEQNGIHLVGEKTAATFGRNRCKMLENLKGYCGTLVSLWKMSSYFRLISLNPCSSYFLKWDPLYPDSICDFFCNNSVCAGENVSVENLWIISTGITNWSLDTEIWLPWWWLQIPGVSHSDGTWQFCGSGTGDWHGDITQSNPRSVGKACHCLWR